MTMQRPPVSRNRDPRELLMGAHKVLNGTESVLDGYRSIVVAALLRQSIELVWEQRLEDLGVDCTITKKSGFLCLDAATDDPEIVRQAYGAWKQLSDACHGTSYELAPSNTDLERLIGVIARFIGK